MNRRLATLLLSALALWMSASARADRDIVYAARYYAPPGSHRTSHFHLYRINPDGTGRTQLTYGNQDDTDPHWSPDGRKIVFVRDGITVCVANADGSGLQRLAVFKTNDYVADLGWLPGGRTLSFIHTRDTPKVDLAALWLLDVTTRHARRWANVIAYAISPNGHRLFLEDDAGQRLVSLAGQDQEEVRFNSDIADLVWLGGHRLVGVVESPCDAAPAIIQVMDTDGRERTRLTLRYPRAIPWAYPPHPLGDGEPSPSPRPGTVVWSLSEENSTVLVLYAFYLASLTDGAMHFLAQGQFLAWSSDGGRFCTAPGRDTWTYKERKWDGSYRTVWAAPLQVGALGGKLKTITPGLVWVTGADWRKRQ